MTERAQYWQGHLDRWARSGLSQAAFCRRHGLKAVTFGWWKRRLATGRTHNRRRVAAFTERREPSGKQAASHQRSSSPTRTFLPKGASWLPGVNGTSNADFVEVAITSAGMAEVAMTSVGLAAYEVVLSRGVVLRLPADFDPDRVAQLIAVVESATGRTVVQATC